MADEMLLKEVDELAKKFEFVKVTNFRELLVSKIVQVRVLDESVRLVLGCKTFFKKGGTKKELFDRSPEVANYLLKLIYKDKLDSLEALTCLHDFSFFDSKLSLENFEKTVNTTVIGLLEEQLSVRVAYNALFSTIPVYKKEPYLRGLKQDLFDLEEINEMLRLLKVFPH